MFLPKDIQDLLNSVQEKVGDKFEVYLAGGYLRDLYCTLTPKDVDIFFVPKKGFEGESLSYFPTKFYITYNKNKEELSETSDMTERGISQVVGLLSNKLSTPEVQFIVYSKHLTMQELMSDFDMNICETAYRVSDDFYSFTESFFKGHQKKEIKFTKHYNKKRMYERYIRMKYKFPEYECLSIPETPECYLVNSEEQVLSSCTGSFLGDDE